MKKFTNFHLLRHNYGLILPLSILFKMSPTFLLGVLMTQQYRSYCDIKTYLYVNITMYQ